MNDCCYLLRKITLRKERSDSTANIVDLIISNFKTLSHGSAMKR